MGLIMDLKRFNDKFQGILKIKLDRKLRQINPKMMNQFAEPGSKLVSMDFIPQIYESDFRSPTKKELNQVVLKTKTITLLGLAEKPIKFNAPNGEHFTAGDLLNAVKETEIKTRADTEWFGGIDCHHVYYEGLERVSRGKYQIYWGS